KGYESFSSLFYFWGAKNVLIKDSEFIGAGGPVIIADHYKPLDADGGKPTYVNIVNSKMQSVVSGLEPWFANYGATQIVQDLASADTALFGTTNKTIVADSKLISGDKPTPYMNIVIAMKSSSAQGLTSERIKGKVNIFKTQADYEKHYGLNGQAQEFINFGLDMDSENSLMNKAFNGVHYFQSNGNGGYINATASDTSFPTTPYSVGTHLNIYTPLGIGVIVELLNRQPA
ncbi:MAG: hypothetical protein ACOX6H_04605, partial [Christensenellales bacterium]